MLEGRLLPFTIAILVLTASTILHDPDYPVILSNWGLKYSDVVYGVFFPTFEKPERWFNSSEYSLFVASYMNGEFKCPIPYFNYKFEYPPLVGLIWYISTCMGFVSTRVMEPQNANFSVLLRLAARVHFYVQVAFIACFFLITIHYLFKLGASTRRVLMFALLPSTLIYLTYNWDVVAAGLAVAGLYSYTRRKHFIAGAMMGLSIASKILTAGLATWILIELFLRKEKTHALRYFLGLVATLFPAFGLLILLSPNGFLAFVRHHTTWYCENCLYALLVSDIHSKLHRLSYIYFLTLSWLFMIETRTRTFQSTERYYWILSLYTVVLFNYVFSPQMMLLLTPISLLLLGKELLYAYAIADASNAMIITIFFKDAEVRTLLGLTPRYSPWTIDSPVQWFATSRNLILLFILIYTGFKIVSDFTDEHSNSSNVKRHLRENISL